MARLRTNFVTGLVENNPLAIGGTTLTSAGLADLEVVASPDVAVIVIDPDGVSGDPEIVYVTAHTAAATSATITRAQEGTTARQHNQNTRWIHAPVENDWDHGNLAGLADDDHSIYVKADGTRNVTGVQIFQRTSSTDNSIQARVSTDTQPRFQVRADGQVSWGAGGSTAVDTNLYRSTANELKTDDNLSVAGGTISIGADCSLARSGANTLQTGGALNVQGLNTSQTSLVSSSTSATQSLRIKVTAESNDRLIVTADGAMTWGSGSAAGDTNLYRSGANTLKTDDTFVTPRLDVGTNTFAFVPVGCIMPFAGASLPSGWLACDGSAVSRTTYAALFTALSTTYGSGDGVNTFNVPDLRTRFVAGTATNLGSSSNRMPTTYSAGTRGLTGGSEEANLSTSQIPNHQHSINHPHTASDSGHTHGMYAGAWCNGSSFHVINDNYVSSGNFPHYFDLAYATQTGFASITVTPHTGNSGFWPNVTQTAVSRVPPSILIHYIIKF